jgi:hypothetical protein
MVKAVKGVVLVPIGNDIDVVPQLRNDVIIQLDGFRVLVDSLAVKLGQMKGLDNFVKTNIALRARVRDGSS